MIEKEILENLIKNGKNMWEMIEILGYSRGSIMKYMKLHGIDPPKKFYCHRDKKVGRTPGFTMSEEQKQYMSKRFSGKNNPFYGKKHTEETRKKMSENHADFTGDKNPFGCSITASDENRRKHEQRKKDWWDKNPEKKKELSKKRNTGFMDISGYFFSRTKHNALNRNLCFDIDIHDCWDLFIKQNKRCALSGIKIELSTDINKVTASIDRIDCNKGYTLDNIQWVHKDINFMRNTLTVDEFVFYCKKVASCCKRTAKHNGKSIKKPGK